VQSFNEVLFLWLNAPANPPPIMLAASRFLAEDLVWALPPLFVVVWLRCSIAWRHALTDAALAAALALGIGAIIGLVWPHPRPFALGLGHRLIAHAADASFPSDHLTLIWSVAASWGLHRRQRVAAVAVFAAGVAVAWARIYVGVHFPLDMAGALGVACMGALLVNAGSSAIKPLQTGIESLRTQVLGHAIAVRMVSE
jgi:undecaprenyl-diphosphatase